MSTETNVKAITRTDATNQAILGLVAGNDPVPLDRLVAWVEDQVVSSGGKADTAASMRSVNKELKAAEKYGVVKLHKTVTVERVG